MNTTLANTVEALENAPSKGLTRQGVKTMLEEESSKLREEMVEEEIAYRRGISYTDKSMKSIAAQLNLFKKRLLTTVDYIESVAKESECGSHNGNMDTSN
jgi:hypothetical protein